MPAAPGARPRWMLHIQAQFWRVLMGIGMLLHRLARPLPPSPSFSQYIDATISPLKGKFRLQFYVPKDYNANRKLKGKRYPCVINFHGGGFVLGTARDDARWISTVVEQVDAVVVSVDYRLAPEFPFPTAVEDGADAILYLSRHANELQLDSQRFAISGFSSGGNMSFTVPLCLQGELHNQTASGAYIKDGHAGSVPLRVPFAVASSETTNSSQVPLVAPNPNPNLNSNLNPNSLQPPPLTRKTSRLDRIATLRQTGASSLSLVASSRAGNAVSVTSQGSEVKIRGIVSFYPPTDYTNTREQRRQTCIRADQNLPAVFTQLFDDSYLQPPSLDLAHPWLSPGLAPAHMLDTLPNDIIMMTCEWDMLLAEGERFRDRLVNELGKRVHYHCVPGVPHGWDKSPNPLRESPGAREQYMVACKELRRMFDMGEEADDECC